MSKFRIVYTDKIEPHPLNRDFNMEGQRWEEFLASVREHGVRETIVVRYLTDTMYQVLSGHRRLTAAKLVGIEKLQCEVRTYDDHEALEFLVLANFDREDLDPVQEARQLTALAEDGWTEDQMAARLNRSVAWLRNRQGLLGLGDEVCEAVRLPKDDDRHLHLDTVEQILALPEEERQRAVQMVLHPEFEIGTLRPGAARDAIRQTITEPRRRQQEWERTAPELVKAWRQALVDFLTEDEAKTLVVQALPWKEIETTRVKRHADELLAECPQANAGATTGKRWLHLALRNGLPVWVVPAENESMSQAVVDDRLLAMAESAREEAGTESWLLKKPHAAGTLHTERPAPNGDKGSEPDRVQGALDVLEGKGEATYREEEAAETVVEQRVESSAWVNLMPVRELREATKQGRLGEFMEVHPWIGRCSSNDVIAICDWVLSLNQGGTETTRGERS